MRRTIFIVLATAAGLTALIVIAAAIAIKTVDLRTVIGPIQARVKAMTGREVAFNGPIDINVSLEPKIVLSDVTFGNAPGSKTPHMVRIKRLDVQVALLPLLSRRFEVVEVALTDPVIVLETDAQGHANWDFGTPATTAASTPPNNPAATALGVGNVSIDNGTLTYVDGATGKTTRVVIDHLTIRTRRGDGPIEAEFRGKIDNVAVALSGNLGPLDALRANRWPYPIDAKGTIDEKATTVTTKLVVEGNVTRLDDLDFAFGAFKGKGHIAIDSTGKRKRYTFDLALPAIGAGDVVVPIAGAPAAKAARTQSSNRIFSDEPLPISGLKAVDADGHVSIAGLALKNGTKLSDIDVVMTLRDGKLDVSQWRAGALGGTLQGKLTLDATRAESPALSLKVNGRSLDLPLILAVAGTQRQVRGGETSVDIDIVARGVSPHAWASTATGTASAVVGPATLVNTKLDLDNALNRLGHALNPYRERDPSTELKCFVARLPLKDGIAHIDRTIALETDKIGVSASGALDFRNETLDLSLHPHVKQGIPIDIPQIAQLVKFSGPFQHPAVTIDKVATAETLAKIGAAIGTSGLSVVGTSLLKAATEPENVCEVALGKKPAPATRQEGQAKAPPAAAVPAEIGKAFGKLFGR